MNALILAAGYATRMGELTKNFPKPLLPVAGRPIIDYLLDQLDAIAELSRVVVVTNDRFHRHFVDWRAGVKSRVELAVLNDGSTDNEHRRGAIADMAFAIEQAGLTGETLILAADNILFFRLADFAAYYHRRQADCLVVHRVTDLARLRRTGIATLDNDDRLVGFVEKPENPPTQWAVPTVYLLTTETMALISRYLEEGNNPDAPGNLIAWLHTRRPVYAFKTSERILDIGSPETYRAAEQIVAQLLPHQ